MFNLPGRLSRHPRIRAFEGFVDMQWHLDQMHRMAATKDPDVTRSKWLAAFNAIKHHGIDALRRRRGLTSSPAAE
jgi:hypothetical protein